VRVPREIVASVLSRVLRAVMSTAQLCLLSRLVIRAGAWQVVGATIVNCRGTTRMNAHKNDRTTPFGRAVMVRRVLEQGWSVAAVARAFEVSTRTVRKWLARFGSEGVAGKQKT
jgi:hypothetical protein